MKKILTIAGISLLSGTALAREPQPTIEINVDVLQNLVPPPAQQAAPAYKPSVEKPLLMPKTAKPCHKPTKPKTKKKKAQKPAQEKSLPRPEFIKPAPAPAIIVPLAQPEPQNLEEVKTPPHQPIEEALPKDIASSEAEEIKKDTNVVEEIPAPAPAPAPAPEPVVEQPAEAPKLSLQTRILYKLQDWAVAVDVWRQDLKNKLLRKTEPKTTAPTPEAEPITEPVPAPPVDAPKAVEVMKVEKPKEPVEAPKAIEEIKPEPFEIPAEEAPIKEEKTTPTADVPAAPVANDLSIKEAPAAPLADDLAPPAPAVVEEPKPETAFQKFVRKMTSWRDKIRKDLAPETPAEPVTPALPETPPVAAESEKSLLPDVPPAAAVPQENNVMAKLPEAPAIVEKAVLPDAPPAPVKEKVAQKATEKLPDAPPAAKTQVATAVTSQKILPEVPPVPATVVKNTGAMYVIPFATESDEIKLEEQGYLLALVQRLKQDENLRVAVQGFAPLGNGQEYEARRLSLKRAVAVRQFLMDKGVDPTRVNVQALGSATEESLKDRVDILRIN